MSAKPKPLVFWRLTAIRLLRMEYKRGQIWSMRCACGLLVERRLNKVKDSVRQGFTPQCETCAKAVRRTWAKVGREAKRNAAKTKQMWE